MSIFFHDELMRQIGFYGEWPGATPSLSFHNFRGDAKYRRKKVIEALPKILQKHGLRLHPTWQEHVVLAQRADEHNGTGGAVTNVFYACADAIWDALKGGGKITPDTKQFMFDSEAEKLLFDGRFVSGWMMMGMRKKGDKKEGTDKELHDEVVSPSSSDEETLEHSLMKEIGFERHFGWFYEDPSCRDRRRKAIELLPQKLERMGYKIYPHSMSALKMADMADEFNREAMGIANVYMQCQQAIRDSLQQTGPRVYYPSLVFFDECEGYLQSWRREYFESAFLQSVAVGAFVNKAQEGMHPPFNTPSRTRELNRIKSVLTGQNNLG